MHPQDSVPPASFLAMFSSSVTVVITYELGGLAALLNKTAKLKTKTKTEKFRLKTKTKTKT